MNTVAKSAIGLMLITIISKILGFGRELVLANVYGASTYSDAYLIAQSIPVVLFAVLSSAITNTFIPIYYEQSDNNNSNIFTNKVLNIILIISIVIACIGFIFSEELVKIFAMGFDGEVLIIATKFTKIMVIGIIFTSLAGVMKSYLNANNNFIIPGLIGIPFSIIIIISIILSKIVNVYILPIGAVLGIIVQFFIQVPFAYKYGYRYHFYIDFKDEYIKKMMILIAPIFLGVAVNQINTMVDRTIASTLVEGSISALNYANKLNNFVLGLFIASIASVIYPMLSKISFNDKSEFINAIVKIINTVILIIIPISFGAIILSNPIVKFLFQRGAFDERATSMTATALVMYSIGMIGFGIRDILGKVFYSLQDTKTPMINGSIAIAINIVLNIILGRYLHITGLALATSISAIICMFLLFRSLNRNIGYFGQDKIIKTTIKSIIAAVVMSLVTNFAYNLLNNILGSGFISEAIALFGAIGTGAIVYGICIVILKVEEVSLINDMVKKKLKI